MKKVGRLEPVCSKLTLRLAQLNGPANRNCGIYAFVCLFVVLPPLFGSFSSGCFFSLFPFFSFSHHLGFTVTTKVTQGAKNFGSFLYSGLSKASAKIKETVKDNVSII